MLRPERMSKVSVTGAKSVMADVVDAVHDMRLLHVTEYDGSWAGFDPGDPAPDAETASERLVTVRSIESILDIDRDEVDAAPARELDEDSLGERIESVRTHVNDLDDRRSGLRDDLRSVEERLDAIEPFVDLGIDLDLLQGYDTLEVAVGQGNREAVERAILEADELDGYELFTGEKTLAVFARSYEEGALTDTLVGTEFAAVEVPDLADDDGSDPGSVSPTEYAADLRQRRETLERKLETVENELAEVRAEQAPFLLAAEEQLTIRVEKTEAPLTFATTDNAFVAEGWVPTEQYTDFASRLQSAVGEHVEVEELERAEFNHDGTDHSREEVPGGPTEPPAAPTAADGGGRDEEVRADGGGLVTMGDDDDPPVVQDNPDAVRPFEILTKAVGRPNYSEFDPTVVLFLTFPLFFGFMIGDVGYGVIYTAIGYYLWTNFDSDAFRSLGGVTIASGLSTILFGILYGEFFGTHIIGKLFWEGPVGLKHAPIEKGLESPEFISAWILVSVFAGIVHLNVAWIFDFIEKRQLHDLQEAVAEAGSWLLMLNGIWVWVFSKHLMGSKPGFVYTVFDGAPFAFNFDGFPEIVGIAGAVAFFIGLVLLAYGTGSFNVEIVEFLNVLVNALSYTRIAAVLLAKAGMAFAVNLIVFGAPPEESSAFFALPLTGVEPAQGLALYHGGPLLAVVGIVILVIGHALVLALGISSAGLQAVRLEYVEFFTKFYDGGGREYAPFGHERRFTRDT
jgi:V/A-type H+-transporting ATPase subunit I